MICELVNFSGGAEVGEKGAGGCGNEGIECVRETLAPYLCQREMYRDRSIERERERERHSDTERMREAESERETEAERERETERDRDRGRKREGGREGGREERAECTISVLDADVYPYFIFFYICWQTEGGVWRGYAAPKGHPVQLEAVMLDPYIRVNLKVSVCVCVNDPYTFKPHGECVSE
jgi:hypothetical protein